jgi:hypothetical protein
MQAKPMLGAGALGVGAPVGESDEVGATAGKEQLQILPFHTTAAAVRTVPPGEMAIPRQFVEGE